MQPQSDPESSPSSTSLDLLHYEFVKVLGRGSFATVVLAEDRETGKRVAIKLLPRGGHMHSTTTSLKPYSCYISREVLHHASLRHPFVVQVYETFLTSEYLAISMEYADAGCLLTRVQQSPNRRLPEVEARWLFQQLILGLKYCHDRGVSNRDLKLENVLLCTNADATRPLLKISDFGYSKHDANSSAATQCGTEAYMSPEVVLSSGKYDAKKVDTWACGILLYTMLVGSFPWFPTDKQYAARMVRGEFSVPPEVEVSEGCMEVLRMLLHPDPLERAGTGEVMAHPWYQHDLPSGALAMNDYYLQHAPTVEEAVPLVEMMVELANACNPGEPPLSCRFSLPQQQQRQHTVSTISSG